MMRKTLEVRAPLNQGFGIVWIVGEDKTRARFDDV